jgi:hypothetical protein
MSDLNLFNITKNHVTSIESQSMAIERSLQTILERHLEEFLVYDFLPLNI